MTIASRIGASRLRHEWALKLSTLALVAVAVACTAPPGRGEAPQPTAQPGGGGVTLDHLVPARDSVGGIPTRFEWTAVEGADEYAIGVWSEVDVLVWRQGDLHEPSVAWPAEIQLEPGTYFWAVVALRQGRSLADSGRSAFVVR
jgi:hypothetical protein